MRHVSGKGITLFERAVEALHGLGGRKSGQ